MGRACWRKQSQKVGFGVYTSPHLLLSVFCLPVWMKCDQPASCRCHTTPCIPHAYGLGPSGASRQNKLFLKLLLVVILYLSKRRMITQYTYVNTWKCLMFNARWCFKMFHYKAGTGIHWWTFVLCLSDLQPQPPPMGTVFSLFPIKSHESCLKYNSYKRRKVCVYLWLFLLPILSPKHPLGRAQLSQAIS